MPKKEPRVDAYIKKSQPFAQPILKHLRELMHKTCPDVEEKIKWGMPHFDYKGPLANMAAFKKHAVFGFWKAALMKDPHKILNPDQAMGYFGRMEKLSDLPSDKILKEYIQEAMRLNEKGIKVSRSTTPKKALETPDYFMKALRKNKKALATFENFSTTNKREYVEWVTGAKAETTRDQRLETAIEWMAEGKIRNWKYVRK